MNGNGDRCFKISEITELIRGTLESSFSNVRVEGEVSNFRPSSTGHLYFTLKDEGAMLQAVMFRNRIGSLSFTPADGQLVIARGSISVYAKRGTYQIICESLEMAGEGNILAMLERRKRKLAELGLFDPARKKPLPPFPSRIAVVTSPTGAALRDILRVLERRNSGIDLVILPAPVQGDGAGEIIARQIRTANLYGLGDVIIVGRGGGSLEDLLPFSEESVVTAVAESRIPVISAVGHEIDIALSDLAADVRAPTPSAAAEIVSANREEVAERIMTLTSSMLAAVKGRIGEARLVARQFSPEILERNFRILIQPVLLRLDDAKEEIIRGFREALTRFRHRLELSRRELQANSPLGILAKGYAVVTNRRTGSVVRAASENKVGDGLGIRLHRGGLETEVKELLDEEL